MFFTPLNFLNGTKSTQKKQCWAVYNYKNLMIYLYIVSINNIPQINMDREEAIRIIRQVNDAAEAHNNHPDILQQLDIRRNSINNTANYRSGNNIHNVQSLQISCRQDWETFRNLFGCPLFETPPPYVRQLLDHLDNGFGSIYGELQIMLFRSFAGDGLSHYAFFAIIVDPHQHFIDGGIEPFLYTDGDQTDTNLRALFDDNPHSIVREITEYEILDLVNENNTALELLDFFQRNADENVRPPPPPPNRGIDLAELYFAALADANAPDADAADAVDAVDDDNIIPYWLEQNNNIHARG
jgi:hypothetical protein